MALVHDLAEAHVGDITPVEGVSPNLKHQVGTFPRPALIYPC
jgi:putative hydrolase of HD superfamily